MNRNRSGRLPAYLNGDWALIARTKFSVIAQLPKQLGEHWAGGLGNGNTTRVLDKFRSPAWRAARHAARIGTVRQPQRPGRIIHPMDVRRLITPIQALSCIEILTSNKKLLRE
jgi:hypothetical protein